MNKIKRGLLILVCLLLAMASFPLISSQKAHADTLGSVTRYSTPTSFSNPVDVATGSDGNLWFTESNTNKIGKSTISGSVTEYSLPSGYIKPMYITNGPQSAMWFTADGANSATAVGKITTDGTIIMYNLPDTPDRVEKSTFTNNFFTPTSITSGDGHIWVNRQVSRYIQRLSVDGSVTDIKISTPLAEDGIDDINDIKRYYAYELAFDSYEGGGIWIINYFNKYPYDEFIIEKISFDGSRITHTAPKPVTDGYKNITIGADGRLWFGGNDQYTGKIKAMTRQGSFTTSISLPTYRDYPHDVTLGPDGAIWGTVHRVPAQGGGNKIFRVDPSTNQISNEWSVPGTGSAMPFGIAAGPDGNVWFTEYNTYKISKIGAGTISSTDVDQDGLTQAQELQQGSSDFLDDTDSDGLDDLTESQWLTNRDDVFCNQAVTYCEYPDPLQKDLYVEVDWMVKPDPGGFSMQPTSSHIADIEIAFADENIKPHFDTGQLGGGDEIEYASNIQLDRDDTETDIYEYKYGEGAISAAQFNSNRYRIWHYMLLVDEILSDPALLGRSFVGDDDSLVAYGSIKGLHTTDFDDALSGTMMHELGHNLCLTSSQLYWGNEDCIFAGVDNSDSAYEDYMSSMSYHNYATITDYSYGLNGSNDHDDWTPLEINMFAINESGDDVFPGLSPFGAGDTNPDIQE